MFKICRFCLKKCYKYIEVDDIIVEISNIVQLKMDFNASECPVMCEDCNQTLHKCFNFKSACFYTEDFIYPFIHSEEYQNQQLNLMELFITKQNVIKIEPTFAYRQICRFCLEVVSDGSVPICDIDMDILQKCVPELNLSWTKDPMICITCYKFLETYVNFLKMCQETEEEINNDRKMCGTNYKGFVVLRRVAKYPPDDCFRSITNEEVEKAVKKIKVEANSKPVKKEKIHYAECLIKPEIYSENGKILHKTKKNRRRVHSYTAEELEKRKFGCSKCTYRTSTRKQLRIHSFIHVDQSKMKQYECTTCTYKTYRKHHLLRHIKTHYKPPTNIIYKKCEQCDFRSRNWCGLRTHMITHEDPSTLQMVKCKLCSFQTRYKFGLKSHMRLHSVGYPYQCEHCPFKSKYSESYKKHIVKHKDPSEIDYMYCAQCEFKTVRKYQLRIHIMRIHTHPSLVQKFRCDQCDFGTFYKSDLTRHEVKHKERSEITFHKCDSCEYETPFKKSLRKHLLVHKDPSEVEMYKCELCKYETKHKGDLRSHMLVHVSPSALPKFECNICGQSFKRKGNMIMHAAKHQKMRIVEEGKE